MTKKSTAPPLSDAYKKEAGKHLNSLEGDDSKAVKKIIADVMEKSVCINDLYVTRALGEMLMVYGDMLVDQYRKVYGDIEIKKKPV